MNFETTQLSLAQLAILIFAFMSLLSQSVLVPWAMLLLGLALAFSLGTAMAIINKIQNHNPEDGKHQYSAILGTHMGGAICYAITISFFLHKFS